MSMLSLYLKRHVFSSSFNFWHLLLTNNILSLTPHPSEYIGRGKLLLTHYLAFNFTHIGPLQELDFVGPHHLTFGERGRLAPNNAWCFGVFFFYFLNRNMVPQMSPS